MFLETILGYLKAICRHKLSWYRKFLTSLTRAVRICRLRRGMRWIICWETWLSRMTIWSSKFILLLARCSRHGVRKCCLSGDRSSNCRWGCCLRRKRGTLSKEEWSFVIKHNLSSQGSTVPTSLEKWLSILNLIKCRLAGLKKLVLWAKISTVRFVKKSQNISRQFSNTCQFNLFSKLR